MVLLTLNVLLVFLAAVTGIMAIFGETKRNGRLTKIGMVALLLGLATLAVGIVKEVQAKLEADAAQRQSEELEEHLRGQLANLERALRAERVQVQVLPDPEVPPAGSIRGQIVNPTPFATNYLIDVAAITGDGRWLGAAVTNTKGYFRIDFDPSGLGNEAKNLTLIIDTAGRKRTFLVDGVDSTKKQSIVVTLPKEEVKGG